MHPQAPLFINGDFVESQSGRLPNLNPAAQRILAEIPCATDDEIKQRVINHLGSHRHLPLGQVSINVPIPVLLPISSLTGRRNSFYGDQHAHGKQAVRLYTETQTVTARWLNNEAVSGPNMTIQLK